MDKEKVDRFVAKLRKAYRPFYDAVTANGLKFIQDREAGLAGWPADYFSCLLGYLPSPEGASFGDLVGIEYLISSGPYENFYTIREKNGNQRVWQGLETLIRQCEDEDLLLLIKAARDAAGFTDGLYKSLSRFITARSGP